MKVEWIEAFLSTADARSISAAARKTGLAKSVISERLAELERVLGTRLIQRTTRSLALTEDGARFALRARRIVAEMAGALDDMAQRRGTLVGPLRISAPVSFGYLHLGDALYAFLAAHPELELTLDLDERFVDAVADGYDAVIRHGPIADDRLVVERLSVSRRILVAAPAYLAREGTPRSVAELTRHRGIIYSNRDADWRFRGGDGWNVVRPRWSLRVNNGLIMRGAALAGLGLALLPSFFVHEQLADGRLVHVDVGAEAEGAELFVCHPAANGQSAKVDALVAWLRTAFGVAPIWDRQVLEPSSPN